MRSGESMTLLEAVGAYSGSIKAGDNHEELHRELYRFVNWCGSDRVLSDIGPPEVGEYADHVAGSGTTLRAAVDLGRRAVGIEIHPVYCQRIDRRMAQQVLL